jgi:hypothetical protein
VNGTNVGLRFDRPLDLTTATNPANYTVNGGSIAVLRAALGLGRFETDGGFRPDQRTVNLTLAAPVTGTFTVSPSTSLRDAQGGGYAGGSVTGRLWATSARIGTPAAPILAAAESAAAGSGRIACGGTGFRFMDDGWFFHEQRQGDFRVKVRLDSVALGGPFANAGLHVRETLAGGSKSVVLALEQFSPFNPGIAGDPPLPGFGNTIIFTFRNFPGAGHGTTQTHTPPASPNRWLSLERKGHVFSAAYSENGHDWISLGSSTVTMSNAVLVGFAATATSFGSEMYVDFSEYGDVEPATPVSLSAKAGANGDNKIEAQPSAGSLAAAKDVTGPFQPVPASSPPVTVPADEERRFIKSVPRPPREEYGRIEGTVVNAQGVPLTNQLVEVDGFSHPQLTGAQGEFRFRLLPPGEHRLRFISIGTVIDSATGETNETEVSLSLPVVVTANTGVTVAVKLDLPAVNGPLDAPPCDCVPWCGIGMVTVNGVTTLAAAGGKLGSCDDGRQVTLTGPGGVTVTNPPKGRRTIENPPSGAWTITATVCGKSRTCEIAR